MAWTGLTEDEELGFQAPDDSEGDEIYDLSDSGNWGQQIKAVRHEYGDIGSARIRRLKDAGFGFAVMTRGKGRDLIEWITFGVDRQAQVLGDV